MEANEPNNEDDRNFPFHTVYALGDLKSMPPITVDGRRTPIFLMSRSDIGIGVSAATSGSWPKEGFKGSAKTREEKRKANLAAGRSLLREVMVRVFGANYNYSSVEYIYTESEADLVPDKCLLTYVDTLGASHVCYVDREMKVFMSNTSAVGAKMVAQKLVPGAQMLTVMPVVSEFEFKTVVHAKAQTLPLDAWMTQKSFHDAVMMDYDGSTMTDKTFKSFMESAGAWHEYEHAYEERPGLHQTLSMTPDGMAYDPVTRVVTLLEVTTSKNTAEYQRKFDYYGGLIEAIGKVTNGLVLFTCIWYNYDTDMVQWANSNSWFTVTERPGLTSTAMLQTRESTIDYNRYGRYSDFVHAYEELYGVACPDIPMDEWLNIQLTRDVAHSNGRADLFIPFLTIDHIVGKWSHPALPSKRYLRATFDYWVRTRSSDIAGSVKLVPNFNLISAEKIVKFSTAYFRDSAEPKMEEFGGVMQPMNVPMPYNRNRRVFKQSHRMMQLVYTESEVNLPSTEMYKYLLHRFMNKPLPPNARKYIDMYRSVIESVPDYWSVPKKRIDSKAVVAKKENAIISSMRVFDSKDVCKIKQLMQMHEKKHHEHKALPFTVDLSSDDTRKALLVDLRNVWRENSEELSGRQETIFKEWIAKIGDNKIWDHVITGFRPNHEIFKPFVELIKCQSTLMLIEWAEICRTVMLTCRNHPFTRRNWSMRTTHSGEVLIICSASRSVSQDPTEATMRIMYQTSTSLPIGWTAAKKNFDSAGSGSSIESGFYDSGWFGMTGQRLFEGATSAFSVISQLWIMYCQNGCSNRAPKKSFRETLSFLANLRMNGHSCDREFLDMMYHMQAGAIGLVGNPNCWTKLASPIKNTWSAAIQVAGALHLPRMRFDVPKQYMANEQYSGPFPRPAFMYCSAPDIQAFISGVNLLHTLDIEPFVGNKTVVDAVETIIDMEIEMKKGWERLGGEELCGIKWGAPGFAFEKLLMKVGMNKDTIDYDMEQAAKLLDKFVWSDDEKTSMNSNVYQGCAALSWLTMDDFIDTLTQAQIDDFHEKVYNSEIFTGSALKLQKNTVMAPCEVTGGRTGIKTDLVIRIYNIIARKCKEAHITPVMMLNYAIYSICHDMSNEEALAAIMKSGGTNQVSRKIGQRSKSRELYFLCFVLMLIASLINMVMLLFGQLMESEGISKGHDKFTLLAKMADEVFEMIDVLMREVDDIDLLMDDSQYIDEYVTRKYDMPEGHAFNVALDIDGSKYSTSMNNNMLWGAIVAMRRVLPAPVHDYLVLFNLMQTGRFLYLPTSVSRVILRKFGSNDDKGKFIPADFEKFKKTKLGTTGLEGLTAESKLYKYFLEQMTPTLGADISMTFNAQTGWGQGVAGPLWSVCNAASMTWNNAYLKDSLAPVGALREACDHVLKVRGMQTSDDKEVLFRFQSTTSQRFDKLMEYASTVFTFGLIMDMLFSGFKHNKVKPKGWIGDLNSRNLAIGLDKRFTTIAPRIKGSSVARALPWKGISENAQSIASTAFGMLTTGLHHYTVDIWAGMATAMAAEFYGLRLPHNAPASLGGRIRIAPGASTVDVLAMSDMLMAHDDEFYKMYLFAKENQAAGNMMMPVSSKFPFCPRGMTKTKQLNERVTTAEAEWVKRVDVIAAFTSAVRFVDPRITMAVLQTGMSYDLNERSTLYQSAIYNAARTKIKVKSDFIKIADFLKQAQEIDDLDLPDYEARVRELCPNATALHWFNEFNNMSLSNPQYLIFRGEPIPAMNLLVRGEPLPVKILCSAFIMMMDEGLYNALTERDRAGITPEIISTVVDLFSLEPYWSKRASQRTPEETELMKADAKQIGPMLRQMMKHGGAFRVLAENRITDANGLFHALLKNHAVPAHVFELHGNSSVFGPVGDVKAEETTASMIWTYQQLLQLARLVDDKETAANACAEYFIRTAQRQIANGRVAMVAGSIGHKERVIPTLMAAGVPMIAPASALEQSLPGIVNVSDHEHPRLLRVGPDLMMNIEWLAPIRLPRAPAATRTSADYLMMNNDVYAKIVAMMPFASRFGYGCIFFWMRYCDDDAGVRVYGPEVFNFIIGDCAGMQVEREMQDLIQYYQYSLSSDSHESVRMSLYNTLTHMSDDDPDDAPLGTMRILKLDLDSDTPGRPYIENSFIMHFPWMNKADPRVQRIQGWKGFHLDFVDNNNDPVRTVLYSRQNDPPTQARGQQRGERGLTLGRLWNNATNTDEAQLLLTQIDKCSMSGENVFMHIGNAVMIPTPKYVATFRQLLKGSRPELYVQLTTVRDGHVEVGANVQVKSFGVSTEPVLKIPVTINGFTFHLQSVVTYVFNGATGSVRPPRGFKPPVGKGIEFQVPTNPLVAAMEDSTSQSYASAWTRDRVMDTNWESLYINLYVAGENWESRPSFVRLATYRLVFNRNIGASTRVPESEVPELFSIPFWTAWSTDIMLLNMGLPEEEGPAPQSQSEKRKELYRLRKEQARVMSKPASASTSGLAAGDDTDDAPVTKVFRTPKSAVTGPTAMITRGLALLRAKIDAGTVGKIEDDALDKAIALVNDNLEGASDDED